MFATGQHDLELPFLLQDEKGATDQIEIVRECRSRRLRAPATNSRPTFLPGDVGFFFCGPGSAPFEDGAQAAVQRGLTLPRLGHPSRPHRPHQRARSGPDSRCQTETPRCGRRG